MIIEPKTPGKPEMKTILNTTAAILVACSITPMTMTWGARAMDSAELDYATVSAMFCKNFLEAYGTKRFSSLDDAIVGYIDRKEPDNMLGSGINISCYVLTECRLHEEYTVGWAVEYLFYRERHDTLPRIPIGGATEDPQVHKQWNAFDRWVHHKGPRPHLQ